jgi:hypothetical protein
MNTLSSKNKGVSMIRCLRAGLLALGVSTGASAQEAAAPHWELAIAPFALHWSYNSEHRNVYLLGLDRVSPGAPSWSGADATFWGFAAFTNSFGQPSAYAYGGYRWDGLFGLPALYLKVTGGILYGYKGEYKDKVPLNHNGFSPAIIPAIGYRLTPNDSLQVGMLGTAGLIFSYGRRF